jgi:predicted nucleic acid-binding protein
LSLSVTLADANILVSRTLRDYFVYAAKAGALQIHWSQSILDEMSRNLRAKFALTEGDTAVLELGLSEYLPRALVETRKRDHEIVEHVAMDTKDRHVLAAAQSAKADVLLTNNTRHFPRDWMAKRGIELREAHRLTVARSPKTEAEILATLESQIGKETTDAVRAVVTPS